MAASAAAVEPSTIYHSTTYVGLAGTSSKKLSTAERRITWALSLSQRLLNLAELKLVSLPEFDHPSNRGFNALRFMYCHDNQLTSLPESLGLCTALERLWCHNNLLTKLPESLGRCTALKALRCKNNLLTKLPESLSQCVALISIGCEANQLTELPDSLGQCIALRIIDCGGNQLTSLPESLGRDIALELFSCYDNPWDESWLSLQDLKPGDNPSINSLKVVAKKLAQRRVKTAAVNRKHCD